MIITTLQNRDHNRLKPSAPLLSLMFCLKGHSNLCRELRDLRPMSRGTKSPQCRPPSGGTLVIAGFACRLHPPHACPRTARHRRRHSRRQRYDIAHWGTLLTVAALSDDVVAAVRMHLAVASPLCSCCLMSRGTKSTRCRPPSVCTLVIAGYNLQFESRRVVLNLWFNICTV